MIKKSVKKIANSLGLSVHRFSPSSDPQVQLLSALRLAEIDVLFDVGANVGQFARELRSVGFSGKIISFEPLSAARAALVRLAHSDPSWAVHDRCAIGDHDGEIEINIAGNSVSSSILPMLESHANSAVGSAYVSSERVPICRLDSLAAAYLAPESRLFVKIDTQGYEWQVLDGATDTLKKAQGVLCELSLIPLYEGQRLWRDIVDRMDEEGFMLWALQKGYTDPRTGQSMQMDGVFLRRSVLGCCI